MPMLLHFECCITYDVPYSYCYVVQSHGKTYDCTGMYEVQQRKELVVSMYSTCSHLQY